MTSKNDCPSCKTASGLPLGPGFSRRRFLQIAGTGLVASYFADVVNPSLLFGATSSAGVSLHGTAKQCIFIFLAGAPSQVDLWDLKEGAWTPSNFAPSSYGDVRWPQGLLPNTAMHLDRLAIVRCGAAWVAVHSLGQGWAQVYRNPAGLSGQIAPHIGAVVALESQLSRTPADVLPGFVAVNAGSIPGSGYLPAKYAPFSILPFAEGLATLEHPAGASRFGRRWDLLHKLDANRQGDFGKPAADMNDYSDQAKLLMDTPGINDVFRFNDADHARYGASTFGDSLLVARKLIDARKGVRFVQVTFDGWDHHSSIYDASAPTSLYSQSAAFDPAFGALLGDLASMPGSVGGKTLLDETLVAVVSEFGRSVGPLTAAQGRDHGLRFSTIFAGGGVRGGRILGKTNAAGDQVVDYQWSGQRDVKPEDVACTIYSAMGIDYTTVRNDDPFGSGFAYVPFANQGVYRPVDDLF